jgi:tRNA(His) guanylyltransferase
MKVHERAALYTLPHRMPVIIRVDGKAFHTFTKEMKRPFDEDFETSMDIVALALCKEIGGAELAYVQSDEVSVLVHPYKRHASQAWFGNEVQKMASVSAAIAASAITNETGRTCAFDARVFVLPEAEVANYFVWRQQDATRNSVQMVARSLYSHAECHLKNQAALNDMMLAKGVNWNNLPARHRRGRVVRRAIAADSMTLTESSIELRAGVLVDRWFLDLEPPIFSQRRGYIEHHLATDDEAAA